jgi:hypothetical protein
MRAAFRRARFGILVMAVTYAASITVGIVMVHTGNAAALRFRDALVARANRDDPSARADAAGSHLAAAAIDFSRNLGLAAIPDTIGGLTVVMPIGTGAYRGWVGGIVSVDRAHRSRLHGAYYLVTLLIQVTGFTLAGGAGVYLGIAFLRREGPFVGPRWFRLPATAVRDVAWLYIVIVPIFAAGSLYEYLA